MKIVLVRVLLLVLLGGLSYGDDIQDGLDALNKKDYKTAFGLFSHTCENGEAGGCFMVGAHYEDGLEVEKNNQSALEYYVKACDMGHSDACKYYINLQNKIPVCTQDELSFLNDKRYFDVASSDQHPVIVADAQTIRIDKKHRTIQVWTTFVYNQKARDGFIQDYGENYNNFGVMKALYTINYNNMTNKINTSTNYNCDGSSIETYSGGTWNNIIPDSVMEAITETIIKKYHLK